MPAATFGSYPIFGNLPTPKPHLTLSDAMTGQTDAGTYIKEEQDDFQFNPNRFQSYDMQQQYGNQQFAHGNGQDVGSVNPSDLTMSNNSFINNHQYGSNNMSSSFIMGNSNIADDELLELGNLDEQNAQSGYMHGGEQNNMHSNQHDFYQEPRGSIAINPQANMQQMYSNTPDGGPIVSPFVHDFNYNQFRPSIHGQNGFGQSMQSGSFDMNNRARAKMQQMDRHNSDSRSPMTPKTPAINSLQLGTPDSGSFGSQPIHAGHPLHRHQKSMSGQWDHTPGSGHSQSWIDSPIVSPAVNHPQISEVLHSGKHASLPAKVGQPMPVSQTQEAKKKKRRESHNLVERRRRDNINERIQDLSKLVPSHRLDDEKIRKHINNNGPLSPSLGPTGMSPPQATSLLAGGTGRRAAGNITQGLPIDDKEKGPNKGDILNGAVSWTRDLMWLLNVKMDREEKLKQVIEQLGGQLPMECEQTEDERRMLTELGDSFDNNGRISFRYTRGPGSGLRVPKHTNYAGEPLDPNHRLSNGNTISPQSLSPNNGGSDNSQPQFWGNPTGSNGSFPLKEEDEFGMEIG
ncbi:hypothetical protein K402DRAFT_134359 [Aulographum hederae CBS 113979]|uniref:BHLH domain-containing protein n=1 Tax=Aulographum hederae CBS 113979 TaxID=1176131 RepID=A0A6G1GV80_9PEZI|nr:hypothetical protein K402DRAFT_134359 [Aulographum hederae CBS 113979]